MKKLILFLIKFKWTLMFPFAALFIWAVGFLSSSLERFFPYVLNQVVYLWQHSDLNETYDITRLTGAIAWFVNGINAWIPVYLIVTFVFLVITWRFIFFGIRAFVKLITVGQV